MEAVRLKLRRWLEIKDPELVEPPDFEELITNAIEKTLKASETRFITKLSKLEPLMCVNDGKIVIKGRDNVYTDSYGRIFCSHACIDEMKGKDKK